MIVLRQNLYATAASFKPKFRNRFRNGDFSYVPAKDPKNEMLNHQAYKEVACEDEFKNNPETYKIRQGLFSEKISEDDRKKLKKLAKTTVMVHTAATGTLAAGVGVSAIKSIKNKKLELPHLALTIGPGVVSLGNYAHYRSQVKKMYKKYHPEEKNPTNKEIESWVIKKAKSPYNKTVLDDIIQKKEGKK